MSELDLSKCKNDSEKETANLFYNLGLKCVALNWKMQNNIARDEGEIDGIFIDEINQIYLVYDDSTQKDNRQDKIAKFLTKWKNKENQIVLKSKLKLKDYPIYVIYIDNSIKLTKVPSIHIHLDNYTKIIYYPDFNYFKNIFNIIGKWALNDLYNFLKIEPREKVKKTKEAIQIYFGDTPAYVFADRVDNILKYSFISRRRGKSMGYQRMIDKKRVNEIASLIESDEIKAFPNSILLNCIDDLNFTPLSKSDCPKQVKIDLPFNFSSCKVVDGQHRLLAFSKLNKLILDNHSLPIVLFQNMKEKDEIQTFIEVNDTQKGVDPNLIYYLKSELKWKEGTKEYLEKIAVQITEMINGECDILKDQIYFGNVNESKKGKLTLTTIVQALKTNKVIDHPKGIFQKKKSDIDTPVKEIKKFYSNLIKIETLNIKFYKSNLGIKIVIKFLCLYQLNKDKKNIMINLKNAIKCFDESVKNNIKVLPKNYGGGGFNKAFEIITECLKTKYKEFNTFEINQKNLQ